MIPESAEVRAEHWRRGDFRCMLPSGEWLSSGLSRLSQWCWDNYALLIVLLCLGGPVIAWIYEKVGNEGQKG